MTTTTATTVSPVNPAALTTPLRILTRVRGLYRDDGPGGSGVLTLTHADCQQLLQWFDTWAVLQRVYADALKLVRVRCGALTVYDCHAGEQAWEDYLDTLPEAVQDEQPDWDTLHDDPGLLPAAVAAIHAALPLDSEWTQLDPASANFCAIYTPGGLQPAVFWRTVDDADCYEANWSPTRDILCELAVAHWGPACHPTPTP